MVLTQNSYNKNLLCWRLYTKKAWKGADIKKVNTRDAEDRDFKRERKVCLLLQKILWIFKDPYDDSRIYFYHLMLLPDLSSWQNPKQTKPKISTTLTGKGEWGQESVSLTMKKAPLCTYLSEESRINCILIGHNLIWTGNNKCSKVNK